MKTVRTDFFRLSLLLAAAIAASGYAEKAKTSFESEVGRYLAGHSLSRVKTCEDLRALIAAPCGETAKIDATVQPRHTSKKVRCWGSMMLPFFKKWGLNVAELDPDALARGLSFIADRPTANYTLHQPQTYKGAGFYFIAFPEMFNTTLEMAKGEKRDFHYVREVSKESTGGKR